MKIPIAFYQLADRRAEAVLPQLVAKALAAGHRVVVHDADPARLAAIDAALWATPADSFVPHAIDTDAGADRAALQPVLLTAAALPTAQGFANGADCLVQVGGDLPDGLTGLTRILYLFDAASLETARARWRKLKQADGVSPVYWREGEGGKFEKAG